MNTDTDYSINTNSLFDNPMVTAAKKSMTPEMLDHYKQIGEEMYGNIDFETDTVLNNMPPPMSEAVAYIEISIRSGQHISTLEPNEKMLLEDAFGSEWYTRYGYSKEDLDNITH
jgi:hypothetical protein